MLLLAHSENAQLNVVTKYGTILDGDISVALLDVWNEACKDTTPSTILIPKGTYPMSQVVLSGPCKAPIRLQIHATLKAPLDLKTLDPKKEWLTIQYVDNFTLSGGGILDGQGAIAWLRNDCGRTIGSCNKLPNNLSLNFLRNSVIQNITSLNSKLFHVNVFGGKNLTIDNFTIIAPTTSINTDGIHVARIVDVTIKNTVIATGDDCISIGDGTENLHVKNVTCGPGHGISVGSLGKLPGEKPVKGIFIKNCTLINTNNGVRVKTWPNSYPGVVTDLHCDDIVMHNVNNPILIDQEYCPYNKCQKEKPSLVKISNVSYDNIKGTSATENAVTFICSRKVPCERVVVGHINLTFHGDSAKSKCSNIKPILIGTQNPPICNKTALPSPSPSPLSTPSLNPSPASSPSLSSSPSPDSSPSLSPDSSPSLSPDSFPYLWLA
nr:polygalacturonase-like [Ipomoea batatas]